jgi:anti-anti-sigma factor
MAIEIESGHVGRQVLKLAGDVTVYQAAELHQAALGLAQQATDLQVQCEEVQSLDCATIQILMALQETLAAQGKTFQLTGASAELQQTLTLAGMALAVA